MNVTLMKKNLNNIPLFHRSDLLLIAVIMIVAAVIFFVSTFSPDGKTAVVTLDGERVTTINLESAKNETFAVGDVFIEVKDGCVSITDSDCPDKTCVKTGELSKIGDVSVCVPNRVCVEIIGESADGVDILSY